MSNSALLFTYYVSTSYLIRRCQEDKYRLNMRKRQRSGLQTKQKPLIALASTVAVLGISLFGIIFLYNMFGTSEDAEAGPTTQYGYGQEITIQATEVAGLEDYSNYPVLIQFTDTSLRTVANGGRMTNSNGYDILFTLGDCLTALDHQLEHYDASTGEIAVWVKVPTLYASADTRINMYYGNSNVSTDASTNAVWDSDYVGIYHLSGDGNDHSGSDDTGTIYGAVAASGIAGDALKFDGSNDYVQTTDSVMQTLNEFSISAWFNNDVHSKVQHIVWQGTAVSNGFGQPSDATHDEVHINIGECCYTTAGSTKAHHLMGFMGTEEEQISTNGLTAVYDFTDSLTWYFMVADFINLSDTPVVNLYVNGTLVDSDTGTTSGLNRSSWDTKMRIGRPGANTRYFDGLIDEVRISSKVRSANYLETYQNNINDPSAFASRTGEMTKYDVCSRVLPIQLVYFNVIREENRIALTWKSASEIDNDYYTIEKSTDGFIWENFREISGAGNSNTPIEYFEYDDNIVTGITYYRLKQTDFNGDFSYHGVRAIEVKSDNSFKMSLYPNPAQNSVTIAGPGEESDEIYVINNTGERIQLPIRTGNQTTILNTSSLSAGAYYVIRKHKMMIAREKLIIIR